MALDGLHKQVCTWSVLTSVRGHCKNFLSWWQSKWSRVCILNRNLVNCDWICRESMSLLINVFRYKCSEVCSLLRTRDGWCEKSVLCIGSTQHDRCISVYLDYYAISYFKPLLSGQQAKQWCFEEVIKDIVQRTTFCIFELLLSSKSYKYGNMIARST